MQMKWDEPGEVTVPDPSTPPFFRGNGADRADDLARGARRLSRAGRPVEAASAWREAAQEFLRTLRPVQAIAAVIEAAFLDPLPAGAEAEIRDAARLVRGGTRSEGQQLLAGLPADARCDLALRLLPGFCGEDEVFAKEDDSSPSLWFVVRGDVRATRRGAKGARATVKKVRDGGLVGDWRQLREGEGAITLVAESPTDLLELRRHDFEDLVRRHPEARRIFDGF